MLTHFVNDLNKLGTNIAGLSKAAQDAIIAQGIEWYYWQANNYAGSEFLTQSNQLLQYTTATGAGLAGAQNKALKYVSPWLETSLDLGAQAGTLLPVRFRYNTYDQWNIAAGSGGVNATALSPGKSQIFVGGSGADNLTGGQMNDFLSGGDGADSLTGGAGDDTLVGGKGSDTLTGGAGNDLYVFKTGDGPDTIVDEGANRIMFNGKLFAGLAIKDAATGRYKFVNDAGKTLQFNSPGVLTLDSTTQITFQTETTAEALNGSFGIHLYAENTAPTTYDRTILGDFAPLGSAAAARYDDLGNLIIDPSKPKPDSWDLLYDSVGNDEIKAFGGNDRIDAWRGGDDKLDGGAGDDIVLGGAGDDIVIGGAGMDLLRGHSGRDKLYAGEEVTLDAALAAQNNLASGLKGDLLDGCEDDDLLIGDVGNDALAGGSGDDIIVGGAGDDNILGDLKTSLVYQDWSIGRSVTVQGNVTMYNLTYNGIYSDAQVAGGADTIFAGAGADWVMGQEGDDYIDGGAGDDVLFGESGADDIIGGAGNDVIVGDSASIPLAENGNDYLDGGDGDDKLFGGGGDDQLFGGNGADKLYGNEGVDVLNGEDGDDTLIGGEGGDQLFGGAGNDFLQGDSAIGTIDSDDYLDGGEGDDIMVGVGGSDEMHGGAGADQMAGDNGGGDASGQADTMYGDAGDDVIDGQGGDDVIDGGADNDLLLGGLGNDVIAGGTGNDQLQGGQGDDALDGGEGIDVLFGEAGNDTLQGGAGNDYLIGGLGDDQLAGGDGDDVYYYSSGEGTDHISDSGGTDWLVFNDIYWSQVGLGVGSLKLTLPGGGAIHLDDFDPDNPFAAGGIEYFQFADGTVMTRAQLINAIGIAPTGTPGPDVLSGTALSETIRALAGDDVVTARAGDDTVYADDGNDVVYGGDGNDTVYGGNGDDMLLGEAGDDTLYGESGNDLLSGGAGMDQLMGGDGNDTYLFQAGDGQDTVTDALGQNQVALGAGLTLDAVRFGRQGNDLLIAIKSSTDTLTVKEWFASDSHFTGVTLADGALLDRAGVQAAIPRNLPPVATTDTATVVEDSVLAASGNALANDSDPEGRSLRVTNPGNYSGTYGSVSLQSDGRYSYALANGSPAVQSLAGGQSVSDSFTYIVTDDDPVGAATAQAAIVVTVKGSNDLPVLGSDVASTMEDAGPLRGNVLANDTDVDAGTILTVADPGARTGSYGALALSGDGSWAYTLANSSLAVQSLAAGQTVTENFAFNVSDGVVQVGGKLTLAVAGANDAPTVVTALADQSAAANTAWSWKVPAGSFADVDAGDALSYRASVADGSALPAWLSFDASTQTFSGRVPRLATGSMDIRVSASDRLGAGAADVFTLNFAAGKGGGGAGGGTGNGGVGSLANQGVGNGLDAPPPGQTISFNDGVGTGPGHPGAQGGNGYRPPRREDLVVSHKQIEALRAEAPAAAATHSNSTQARTAAPGQTMGASTDSAPGQIRKTFYAASSDSGVASSTAAGRQHDDSGDASARDAIRSEGRPSNRWLDSTAWAEIDQPAWDRPVGEQKPATADTTAVGARWLAVQQSMDSEAAAGGMLSAAWSGGSDVAYLRGLRVMGGDFLGSQRATGSDPIGLQAGAGIQQFQGLGRGVQEIA